MRVFEQILNIFFFKETKLLRKLKNIDLSFEDEEPTVRDQLFVEKRDKTEKSVREESRSSSEYSSDESNDSKNGFSKNSGSSSRSDSNNNSSSSSESSAEETEDGSETSDRDSIKDSSDELTSSNESYSQKAEDDEVKHLKSKLKRMQELLNSKVCLCVYILSSKLNLNINFCLICLKIESKKKNGQVEESEKNFKNEKV